MDVGRLYGFTVALVQGNGAARRPGRRSPGDGEGGQIQPRHGHLRHGDHDGDGVGRLGQALRLTLSQLGLDLIGIGSDNNPQPSPSTTTTTTATTTTTTTTTTVATTTGTTGSSGTAIMAAPQSFPATPAPATSGPSPAPAPAGPSPAPAAAPAKAPSPAVTPHTIRSDLHHLMHALFQAIRGQSTDGHGGLSDITGALGALAAQAGSGSAPDGLRDAFTTLQQDASGSAASGPDSTTDGDAGASLQQFLLALQQNLSGAMNGEGPGFCAFQPAGNFVEMHA